MARDVSAPGSIARPQDIPTRLEVCTMHRLEVWTMPGLRWLVLLFALVGLLAAGLPGAAARQDTPLAGWGPAAGAVLQDTAGNPVGTALLAERPDGGVAVFISAIGLEPGEHGLHAHAVGACDPGTEKPFASAGGHFDLLGVKHGDHAGDLGNITIGTDGSGQFTLTTDQFMLTGANALLDADGAAIVVHADRDANDAEGTSFGARIACGVLLARIDSPAPVMEPLRDGGQAGGGVESGYAPAEASATAQGTEGWAAITLGSKIGGGSERPGPSALATRERGMGVGRTAAG